MGGCFSVDQKRKTGKKNAASTLEKSCVSSVLAPAKGVEDLRQAENGNVIVFTYSELKAATKNFRPDRILGEGGFGIVYKGFIDENIRSGFKSMQVAIKELNPDGYQGDKEWLAEVNYLGQLSHPNLVQLIGYCCEGSHRLIVYEYMACGSLEKHLFRRVNVTLTWPKRMKIALDVARGLEYLHKAERSIIYRDFKTSNILLDADYNAKLSDFGLARTGPIGDQTHVSTQVMGTYGYAAPEYIMTGHLNSRSDVYGYGVVFLELLIGRMAIDKSRPTREQNLVDWARPVLVHSKKLLKIIDPRLDGQYSSRAAVEVCGLVYRCLSQNPKGRPMMSEVVTTLESLKDLESEDSVNFGTDGGVVTLFEAPKESVESEGSTEDRAGAPMPLRRRRARQGDPRSKSEPPAEYKHYMPSPESDSHQSGLETFTKVA